VVPSSCGVISAERATKETIEPGRWLHSGDIAVKDENGYIFIVDFRAAERPASSSNPA
jgi:long-subunit acyl-CoA synthetase (AMP-forming)